MNRSDIISNIYQVRPKYSRDHYQAWSNPDGFFNKKWYCFRYFCIIDGTQKERLYLFDGENAGHTFSMCHVSELEANFEIVGDKIELSQFEKFLFPFDEY